MTSSGRYRLISTFNPGDGLMVPSPSPSSGGLQYYPRGLYGNPLTSESDIYGSSAPYYPSGHQAGFYVPGSHQSAPPVRTGPLPSDGRSVPLIENFTAPTETPIDFSGPETEPLAEGELKPPRRHRAKTDVYVAAALVFFAAGGYYFIYRSAEAKLGPQSWKVWLGIGLGLTGVAITGKIIHDRDR